MNTLKNQFIQIHFVISKETPTIVLWSYGEKNSVGLVYLVELM